MLFIQVDIRDISISLGGSILSNTKASTCTPIQGSTVWHLPFCPLSSEVLDFLLLLVLNLPVFTSKPMVAFTIANCGFQVDPSSSNYFPQGLLGRTILPLNTAYRPTGSYPPLLLSQLPSLCLLSPAVKINKLHRLFLPVLITQIPVPQLWCYGDGLSTLISSSSFYSFADCGL